MEDKKLHHPSAPVTNNLSPSSAVDGKKPAATSVETGYAPIEVKEDLAWLDDLENIEKEAFGFIDAQGKTSANDNEGKEEGKVDEKMSAPKEVSLRCNFCRNFRIIPLEELSFDAYAIPCP